MGDDDKLWARWLARGLLFDQRVASRLNYVAYLRLVERTRRALLEDAKVRSQLITPPDMIFDSLTPTIFLTPFWASDSDYAAQLYRALHSACRANGLFPVAVEFPLDLVAALEAGGSRIRLGDLDVGWMNALMSDPGNVMSMSLRNCGSAPASPKRKKIHRRLPFSSSSGRRTGCESGSRTSTGMAEPS